MTAKVLLTFPNTRTAIAAEKALLAAGLSPTVMPMPEALSAQCGIVLSLPEADLEHGRAALEVAKIHISAVYHLQNGKLSPL